MKLKAQAHLQTIQAFVISDEGQDLIEYALVVSMIAFAATAAMSTLAGGINTAFGNITTSLSTAIA